MTLADRLSFAFGRRLPVVLQTEAAECGVGCLAMLAGFYGYSSDLPTLRRRFGVSLKGTTLANIMDMAGDLELASRPLKLALEELGSLRLPCILHWDLNHFVVLKQVRAGSITIHDPAQGRCTLPLAEVSRHFTGVALELWPSPSFQPRKEARSLSLLQMVGHVSGLMRSMTQVLLLALALEVFTVVSPLFLQWVIDYVVVSSDRDLLTTLGIGFALLMLVQCAVKVIRSWVVMHMTTSLNLQWRANVFAQLLRLPVQYFEKRHLGDITSRFGSIDVIQRTVTTSFLTAVLDGVMTVVTTVLMFIYSPLLAWIAVLALCVYAIARWIWYQALLAATRSEIVFAAKQQSHFLESARGIKAIKLFQRESARRASWLSILVDQINANLRTQRLQIVYDAVRGVVSGVANILIIWIGARMVMDGAFSVGVLMAFAAYRNQFDQRVASLIDRIFEFKLLRLHGERLADIVLEKPEPLRTAAVGTTQLAPSVAVVDLHYRYGAHEPYVLKGLSFEIEAGESVAIVGPSGCGKTTLLNVILGVLPATSGEVRIGGVPLHQVGVDVLRSMVGTVCQDDVLFAGSIADNISFFDAHADRDWIEQCARTAGVHADIMAMPMAYSSLVGDMGTALSGGQKQRIFLARALYKRPKVLLLDEATSHLDVQREREIGAAIQALSLTRIIVAHRAETIASAARVITLANGTIAGDSKEAKPQRGAKAERPAIPPAPAVLGLPIISQLRT